MTWLLLAFTGWAVAITNQYSTPYCVAHAVANCWSIYGYTWDHNYYTNRLWISFDWYNVWWLNRDLQEMTISSPGVYNWQDAIGQINKWPAILNISRVKINIWWDEISRHAMCAVWYDDNYIYVANSRGTGRWVQWYGMIASWDIHLVTLQTLWTQTLTPSLITLTGKKEDLQESKPVVKSPTTNARNTRRRFLKHLD
jgi:hypothetical protein